MLIGLTYDLRDEYLKMGYGEEETAEFDRLSTIESIESSLNKMGHTTIRIGHLQNLITRLSAGEKWDFVFNIAEGLYGYAREAVIPAILESYKIPYTFSDPLLLSLALHKAMTKIIVKSNNFPTPDFYLLKSLDEIENIKLNYPLFAKPVAEGTGKGINGKSKILNKDELYIACKYLLEKYKQEVLIESFLPGREFTVGIVGTGNEAETVGTIEIILNENAENEIYSYTNKENCEELVEYKFINDDTAKKAEKLALDIWKFLGFRDAGRIDLRCDSNNNLHFIEVNPLAGLNPEHSDLPIICSKAGISYEKLIEMIMISALKRLK